MPFYISFAGLRSRLINPFVVRLSILFLVSTPYIVITMCVVVTQIAEVLLIALLVVEGMT